MIPGELRIGTCSWNYDSWKGLVYSRVQSRAAEYLSEYAEYFDTAEIDSWFYRVPPKNEAAAYKAAVPASFRFTCKVPQSITLTHERRLEAGEHGAANPAFLSAELFLSFLEAVDPLVPQIDAIMFEFEYLNRKKMPSLEVFLGVLDDFFGKIPKDLPYALEPRNGNYLTEPYFRFLGEHRIMHVFSEKQYMPHVFEVFDALGELPGGGAVVRLLGGDRRAMEEKTGGRWDRLVEIKPDKPEVADMLNRMLKKGGVTLNVNNHYEGSAPLTIRELKSMLQPA